MKGTKHGGDVLECGTFDDTIGDGAAGLTFEIDDDEIVLGAENLAEVIIAVNADALAGEGEIECFANRGEDFSLAVEDHLRAAADARREPIELRTQEVECGAGIRDQSIANVHLDFWREWFWGKPRIVGIRGECLMQFRGAAARRLAAAR